jgi:hypothetical protein
MEQRGWTCFRFTVFMNINIDHYRHSAIISERDICMDECDSEVGVWTSMAQFSTHSELFFKDFRVWLKRMFL